MPEYRKENNRNFEYERNNFMITEHFPNGGIKCKNYINCGCVLPLEWFVYEKSYSCQICNLENWVMSVANSK